MSFEISIDRKIEQNPNKNLQNTLFFLAYRPGTTGTSVVVFRAGGSVRTTNAFFAAFLGFYNVSHSAAYNNQDRNNGNNVSDIHFYAPSVLLALLITKDFLVKILCLNSTRIRVKLRQLSFLKRGLIPL